MHLTRARDLEPPAFQLHVDLGRGLGEREERRPEAHLERIILEEAAQKLGVHAFQIGEADVLVNPEPFDLVEHRRVRRVGVDAIGAPGSDHLDRRLVDARVAHLHRARMRAQHKRQALGILEIDVESVLHRS